MKLALSEKQLQHEGISLLSIFYLCLLSGIKDTAQGEESLRKLLERLSFWSIGEGGKHLRFSEIKRETLNPS